MNEARHSHRYLTYLLIAALLILGVVLVNRQLNTDDEAAADQAQIYTIGVVNLSPQLNAIYESFRARMTELGYVEGENIMYIYNGPVDGLAALDGEVQALVDQEVDLILSLSTPATQAAQRATADNHIPVVFVPVTDPVGAGIVEDLSVPGGNITGITFGAADGPRLNWLLTLDPTIEQVYVPYNINDASATHALETVQAAADELGIELEAVALNGENDLENAISDIPADMDAVFLLPDSFVMNRIQDWVAQSKAKALPLSVASDRDVMTNGALVSYSFSLPAAGVQAARLAKQILEGSNPGTLPIEMAELYLVINVATADAIDLELSDEILSQADTLVRE